MATIRWIGGASAIAQVTQWTFGGTWIAGETITVVIGSKSLTFVNPVAATTPTLAAAGLVTLFTAADANLYPEFAEETATSAAAVFTLTEKTPGKPFTAVLSTNSASGTIGSATVVTANSGPSVFGTAKNWQGGVIPTTGDTVIFDLPTWPLKYDLDQNGITLADLQVLCEIQIGLQLINIDASQYPEWRDTYLKISTTLATVRLTPMLRLDVGSVQTTARIYSTGSSLERDTQSVILRGTHASNALYVVGGTVGVALHAEASTLLTLSASQNASVITGKNVTLGTVANDGGNLQLNSAVGTSLTQTGGSVIVNGTGAVAQMDIRGGSATYNTTGTLGGNATVVGDGSINFEEDQKAKTVTNPIKVYNAATAVKDGNKVVAALVLDCYCDVPGLGKNVRLTRGAPA